MKKSDIRDDLKKSTNELLEIISDFPEQYFNTQPKNGGWSAGQVAEHLIKVETGTVRIFTGETKTCERDSSAKFRTIKEQMSDFERKMKATGPILPDENPKDKKKVLNKLQDIRQRLTSMIEVHDLSEIITDFNHPIFGTLTRLEWIWFNIHHGRRHARQIQKLADSFIE